MRDIQVIYNIGVECRHQHHIIAAKSCDATRKMGQRKRQDSAKGTKRAKKKEEQKIECGLPSRFTSLEQIWLCWLTSRQMQSCREEEVLLSSYYMSMNMITLFVKIVHISCDLETKYKTA